MLKLLELAAATICAFCLIAVAALSPAQAQETDYAMVKGWRVFSGPAAVAGGDMCYASKDNGAVELRLATEGTGEWLLGVPYYDDGEVKGQLGFDGIMERTTFMALQGWAYTSLSDPDLLKSADEVALKLDRGKQVFDLTGSAAAMTKVEECVANGGKPPRKKTKIRVVEPDEQSANENSNVEDDAMRMGRNCPKLGAVVSEDTGRKAKVTFRYKIASDIAAMIYWLDFNGKPVEMSTFHSGEPVVRLNSYVGHSFIVKDFDGNCYGDFFEVQPGNNTFVVR